MSPDGDSRELAFYCAELSLYDEQGDSLVTVDVGGDEAEVSFGSGVYPPEDSGSSTWRWLGGPAGTAVVEVASDIMSAATELRLDGSPIESGLSVRAVVDGVAGEAVDMGADNRHMVAVPLP